MRKHLFILLFIAGFISLGIFMEKSETFRTLKGQLQKITVPSPPMQFGKRGDILEMLGFEPVFPKDYAKYVDARTGLYRLKDIISLDSPRPEYSKDWRPHTDIPMDQYPSSLIMDQQAVAKKLPILSVVVDETDLYDPATGIIANNLKKGKSWERPCFISYYDKGKLLFASGAGVRIHGINKSKIKSWPLRFYFRSLYGHDQFPPGILFAPESVPIQQIIARREPNFRSMLAMDLAKRIGCLVPEFHPAIVYLNGAEYGRSYVLIEHLNDKWLRSRYGHDDFILLRTTGHKEQRDNSSEYQQLITWANDKDIRMTMQEVGKRVDIENMCRWFMSQFYTAGYDEYQGPIVLDTSRPDAKWFWINWDMDGSFANSAEPEKEHIWEKEVHIHNVMLNPERDRNNPKTARYQNEDPRAILFRRMHREDPNFRVYFERLYMDVMNHKLTPRYLEAWFDRHSRDILSINPDEQSFLEEKLRPFITHRSDYLRELMQKYFGSEKSYACTVEGLESVGALVDGFQHEGPYEGWYFKGSTVTITLMDTGDKSIDYWTINGRKTASNGPRLTHTIDTTTTIRPVFKRP